MDYDSCADSRLKPLASNVTEDTPSTPEPLVDEPLLPKVKVHKPVEYIRNINEINRWYGQFDLEEGLPSTTLVLGEGASLQVKCFMIWHVMSTYLTEDLSDWRKFSEGAVLIDPNSAAYIISYYDKYEVPTCYRQIRLSWQDFSIVAKVAGATSGGGSRFFRDCIEKYLVELKLIAPIVTPPARWHQRILNWFR